MWIVTIDLNAARERAEAWVRNRDGSCVTRDTALGEDHMALDVLDLARDNARLQRELDEALRMLSKKTGMRNWDRVIAQRALPWWSRKTCETCKGRGEIPVDKWSAADGIEPSRCDTCKGEGEVWEAKLHDPNGPPCDGCPNPTCSDYELCARKRLL
jgi:hypothetical protein